MSARALRSTSTDAELLLWHHLRSRQLNGCKFRRQRPVGSFIADFACLEAGLIVELDGGQHFEPEAVAQDAHRTAALQRAGFTVLRFDNRQVLQETEALLAAIWQWLQSTSPHPSPLSQAGAGVKPSPFPQAGAGAKTTEPS